MDIITVATTIDQQHQLFVDHRQQLNRDLSKVDNLIGDYYHVLELLPLSAVEMVQIAVKLKTALIHRRELKEGLAKVQAIIDAPVGQAGKMAVDDKKEKIRLKDNLQLSRLSYHRIFGRTKKWTTIV